MQALKGASEVKQNQGENCRMQLETSVDMSFIFKERKVSIGNIHVLIFFSKMNILTQKEEKK